MRINEIISEWIIMPQSIKPLGLIRKPGGGFDFKNHSNNRANEAPIEQDKDNPIAKPYVDMPEWKALHDMDDEIIQAYIKHKEVKEKAPPGREHQVKALKGKVDNPYAVAWAQHNKHGKPKSTTEDESEAKVGFGARGSRVYAYVNDQNGKSIRTKGASTAQELADMLMRYGVNGKEYFWFNSSVDNVDQESMAYDAIDIIKKNKKEDAAGVGIVTKQNATKDVPKGGEYMNVKKLKLD